MDHQSGKEMLNYVEDKFYTILYSLHAVLQHAFTLTHPKQNKNVFRLNKLKA